MPYTECDYASPEIFSTVLGLSAPMIIFIAEKTGNVAEIITGSGNHEREKIQINGTDQAFFALL